MAVSPLTLSHPQQQKLRLDEVQQEHGVRGFQPISYRPGGVQRHRCECERADRAKEASFNLALHLRTEEDGCLYPTQRHKALHILN